MSKKWNKIVALLAAAALATSLMAGCSKKGTDGGATNPTGATDGPVTIQWLGYDTYAQPDENSEYVKKAEEKFNAKFKFWFIDDQRWDDQLNVKFAAGEMPDILKIRSGLNDVKKYVDNGILAPIDKEKIKKFAPSFYKMIDAYPQAWDSVSYNGKVYGIPTVNHNAAYPTMVIWNKTWLDNVGITKIPETLAEYEEALTKFRNNDPDKDGKQDTYGLSDFALPMILGAYGYPGITNFKDTLKNPNLLEYTIKDKKVQLAAIQPEMKEALALLNKWYKAGLIDPEFITSENTGGYWANTHAFFNGRIGLTGNNTAFYHWRFDLDPRLPGDKGGSVYQEFAKLQPNSKLVTGQPMVGPKGQSGTVKWSTMNSSFLGVTTTAMKNPRILETFLKMVEANTVDEDWTNYLLLGNKGTDYKVENGIFSGPMVTAKVQDKQKAGLQLFNYFGNPEWAKKRDSVNFDWAEKHKMNKGYEPPVLPTVDAYAKNVGALAKLSVESYVKIITGEAGIESFDEYVKKFRANGGDDIEKQINEAYAKNSAK